MPPGQYANTLLRVTSQMHYDPATKRADLPTRKLHCAQRPESQQSLTDRQRVFKDSRLRSGQTVWLPPPTHDPKGRHTLV